MTNCLDDTKSAASKLVDKLKSDLSRASQNAAQSASDSKRCADEKALLQAKLLKSAEQLAKVPKETEKIQPPPPLPVVTTPCPQQQAIPSQEKAWLIVGLTDCSP